MPGDQSHSHGIVSSKILHDLGLPATQFGRACHGKHAISGDYTLGAVASGIQIGCCKPVFCCRIQNFCGVISLSVALATGYKQLIPVINGNRGSSRSRQIGGRRQGAPLSGGKVIYVHLRDQRRKNATGAPGQSSSYDIEFVANDRRMEMIPRPRSVCQRGPGAGGGIKLIEPGPVAAVVPIVISGDDIELAVVNHQAGRTSFPGSRDFGPLYPFIHSRIVGPHIIGGHFIRIGVVLESTDHPDQPLILNRLEMVEILGSGIGNRTPGGGTQIEYIQGFRTFPTPKKVKLIAGLYKGTFVAPREVFIVS